MLHTSYYIPVTNFCAFKYGVHVYSDRPTLLSCDVGTHVSLSAIITLN